MQLSHFSWNLGGLALPLGVAFLTVPHLIENLGQERFGLLALAWGLIGYAGSLDLGLGRALTQMVARMRGDGKLSSIPDVLTTAGRITLVTGLIGGGLIGIAALMGGQAWIRTQSTSASEIQSSMVLLAIALPAQAMSATYRGLNEAFMNFKGISLLRAGLGVVNFAGPYAVSIFTIQLPWLVATLVVSRLMALLIFRHLAIQCLKYAPETRGPAVYSASIAKSLFAFGGWVTVSSIVSPILVQADRFVIAATISAAAVSVYVVPYELVVQSLVLVGAVSSVMFPSLSQMVQEKPSEWKPYFFKWLIRVACMMAVVCSALAFLLPLILPLWIKNNIQPESILVGQVLCLGVFANALGSMFYALLHARGRSDLTAKLHLVEAPFFLISLFYFIDEIGIVGVAWTWVARMIIDLFSLIYFSRKLFFVDDGWFNI